MLLCTLINFSWGRFGFDRMFGENRLRVRALFTVINEQKKLNANNKTSNIVDASNPAIWAKTPVAIAA